jgi:16S rRNA G966 N2-methylase RsmD
LLPRYVGKVKCIYIDPPYNSGNEGWVYKVNSPQICKWLGEVVGTEGETLDRLDRLRWYPAAWCRFRRSSAATGLGKRRRNPSWVFQHPPPGKIG